MAKNLTPDLTAALWQALAPHLPKRSSCNPKGGRPWADDRAALRGNTTKTEPERQAIISSIASTAATLSTPAMLDGGKFAFPQEAYVAIASPSGNVG